MSSRESTGAGEHVLAPPGGAFAGPIHLSVAAPAYNEAAGLARVLEGWVDYLSRCPEVASFEIVVTNDGSRDSTGEILDALAAEYRQVRPVHFPENQGAAAALTAAIARTSRDWVLLTDSDGQFPIENLAPMLDLARARKVPAVIGVRAKKDSLFARFGTASSGTVANMLHGSRLRDFNSACKLVWGPLLRALPLEARGMNYSTEVTSRLLEYGVKPAETEIEHRPRESGVSSMRLVRGAIHRMLFLSYIAYRQILIRVGVLRRPGA